ncbi:MAG: RdgB/HAM1 family non-canonical purine NTP pyrophosphatase [Eggerthellaceae bacterium]|jgi:XTP/dITP diphosphohydrolase|nr:RdgB/HAM1 family non-canonical purine NTP pyrophosphatase [Eggerthellaceae bacterium]MCH4221709.1 RdgB/HAM1 family non-canonical purine NTP pyrophosphatase [Eggerthellaceae bacterium]
MKTIIIASNNAHKIEEIETALDFDGWTFQSMRQTGIASDPEETADSFEGNARIKAEAVRALCSGQTAVLADDSGLEVDALDGAPGVRSARYAGEPCDDASNNAKLLRELAQVPADQRTARFVCTLVMLDGDTEYTVRGTIEGSIGFEARGEQGFGYDPLFLPDCLGGNQTFAEVSQERKNAISHRGNALRKLKDRLSAAYL